ncbi:hypothetical protein Ancab_003225 [Ancistrocladus abbreviatus]
MSGASRATGTPSGDGQQQQHRPGGWSDPRTRPYEQQQVHGTWGTSTTTTTSPSVTGVHDGGFATGHGGIPGSHHGTATSFMGARGDAGEGNYGRDEKKGMSERIDEIEQRFPERR